MDDLEKRLREARLAEPSAELDHRMDEAFRIARRAASRGAVLSVRHWWLGAAAAGLSLAAGLLVSVRRDPPAAPAPIVYRIEATGRLHDLLVNPAGGTDVLLRFASPVASP